MKKLKNLWKNNKILMILGAILLVCLIAIIVVVLTYFVGTKKSVYGNRFDNMKTKITEKEQNAYIKSLEDNSSVSKVRFRVNHKTLMISVTFKNDIKLDDAKKIIDTSLEKLSDPVKETYDINFTINIYYNLFNDYDRNNGLFWNNNTPVESK